MPEAASVGGGGGAAGGPRFGAGIVYESIGVRELLADVAKVKSAYDSLNGDRSLGASANAALSHQQAISATASTESMALMAQGENLKNWGMNILGTLKSYVMGFAQVGAQFESVDAQLKLAFGSGEAAEAAKMQAIKVAETTNLLTTDVLNSVAKFKRKGIDSFKEYEDATTQTKHKTLVLMSDLVMGSGQSAENVQYNMNLALNGAAINFRQLFDGIDKAEVAKFRAKKTAQERMDFIAETIISQKFAGISAASENTFKFISDNLNDVIQNLKGLLGQGFLTAFTPAAKELFTFLTELKDNKEFMSAMRDIMKDLGEKAAKAVTKILEWGRGLRDMVTAHPWLIKLGVILATVAGALLTIAGTTIIVGATFRLFGTTTLPVVISGLKTMVAVVASLGWWMLPLVAAGAMLYAAWKHDFGGLKTFVHDVWNALQGLWHLASSWKDGFASMPKDLREKLERAGILDWVVRFGGWLGRTKQFIMDLWELGKAFAKGFFAAVEPAFSAFFDLLRTVFKTIFEIVDALTGVDATDLSGARKEVLGIARVLQDVNDIAADISQVFADSFAAVGKFLQRHKTTIISVLSAIGHVLKETGRAAKDAFSEAVTKAISNVKEAISSLYTAYTTLKETLGQHILPIIKSFLHTLDAIAYAFGINTEKVGEGITVYSALRAVFDGFMFPLVLATKLFKGVAAVVDWLADLVASLCDHFEPLLTLFAEDLPEELSPVTKLVYDMVEGFKIFSKWLDVTVGSTLTFVHVWLGANEDVGDGEDSWIKTIGRLFEDLGVKMETFLKIWDKVKTGALTVLTGGLYAMWDTFETANVGAKKRLEERRVIKEAKGLIPMATRDFAKLPKEEQESIMKAATWAIRQKDQVADVVGDYGARVKATGRTVGNVVGTAEDFWEAFSRRREKKGEDWARYDRAAMVGDKFRSSPIMKTSDQMGIEGPATPETARMDVLAAALVATQERIHAESKTSTATATKQMEALNGNLQVLNTAMLSGASQDILIHMMTEALKNAQLDRHNLEK